MAALESNRVNYLAGNHCLPTGNSLPTSSAAQPVHQSARCDLSASASGTAMPAPGAGF